MPIPRRLLPYLEHEPRRSGLVFGTDGTKPFVLTTGRKRALTAWGWHFRTLEPLPDVELLDRITLHEARHTCASLHLAAGIDLVKVSCWLGHATIAITADR